ncbi:MAG: S8/S53 family peptidase [Oscillochloris sp.]|nr:S8/S53 family peptidase [Oscillochloris sp.]
MFDTTPFSTAKPLPEQDVFFEPQTIDWISPTLSLQAGFLNPAAQLPSQPGDVDIRDHGLFAAGLIHVVAPASSIELIPVLDTYGRGDLYTLTKALHHFIRRSVADDAALTGSVINLSLGLHLPPNPEASGLLPDTTDRVVALEAAMLAAFGFDINVVAASGNQSDEMTAQPAQLPAGYPNVIGIAGSNAARGRSCFANRGDLAAPGGNGASGCTAALELCNGDCTNALIGPILPTTNGASGYAYWNGTSFAAPLTSGAVALLLEQSSGALLPNEIAARLNDRALPAQLPPADTSLGAGILNLRQTIFPFDTHLPILSRP